MAEGRPAVKVVGMYQCQLCGYAQPAPTPIPDSSHPPVQTEDSILRSTPL